MVVSSLTSHVPSWAQLATIQSDGAGRYLGRLTDLVRRGALLNDSFGRQPMERNTDPVAPPPMCRLAFASPTLAWFDRTVRGDVTTAMFKAPSSVSARAQALHCVL
jgi:hypothetical protein